MKEYKTLLRVGANRKLEECAGCSLKYPRGIRMVIGENLGLCERCIRVASTMLANVGYGLSDINL